MILLDLTDTFSIGNIATIFTVLLSVLTATLTIVWRFSGKYTEVLLRITTLEEFQDSISQDNEAHKKLSSKIVTLEKQQSEVHEDNKGLRQSITELQITIERLNTNIEYLIKDRA